jgi:hypothetical protein
VVDNRIRVSYYSYNLVVEAHTDKNLKLNKIKLFFFPIRNYFEVGRFLDNNLDLETYFHNIEVEEHTLVVAAEVADNFVHMVVVVVIHN